MNNLPKTDQLRNLAQYYAGEFLFEGNGLTDDENLEHLSMLVLRCQQIADGNAELMDCAMNYIRTFIDKQFSQPDKD